MPWKTRARGVGQKEEVYAFGLSQLGTNGRCKKQEEDGVDVEDDLKATEHGQFL